MMTPPLMEHDVIATNLQTLLNAALRDHDGTRYAVQRPGLEFPWPRAILAEMDRNGTYKPEPDVAVVDYDDVIEGKRFTDKADLLADDLVVPSAGLACKVADLCRDARRQPRRARGGRP